MFLLLTDLLPCEVRQGRTLRHPLPAAPSSPPAYLNFVPDGSIRSLADRVRECGVFAVELVDALARQTDRLGDLRQSDTTHGV